MRMSGLFLLPGALLSLALPAGASVDAAPRHYPFEAPAPAPRALIVLDPGHGGEDLGAVIAGRREKDITLAVARKVKARLEAAGTASARLTRDADEFVQLDRRVEQSLAWNAALFVSLHVNEVSRHKDLSGITLYSFGKEPGRSSAPLVRRRRVAPLPAPPGEQARASGRLASWMARFLRAAGFQVAPPDRAEYYVLKNPKSPSVLVELGYLTNAAEAKKLEDPAYQDKLADAIARCLTGYLAEGPRRASAALAGR